MNKEEIFTAAIQRYGPTAQEDMAIEEMSELIQAILHNRRGRYSNIAEEIADVEITLYQLKMIHRCKQKVAEYKNRKIVRLAKRLRMKGYYKGECLENEES